MYSILNIWMLWTKAKCRGHAGFQEGGKPFPVKMVSAALVGQSRIAQHRAVHAAIGETVDGEIHALALDLSIPNRTCEKGGGNSAYCYMPSFAETISFTAFGFALPPVAFIT